MNITPTAKSAILSGAIAGALLAALEHVAISQSLHMALAMMAFVGSALLFAVGHENIHVRSVWRWSDLTEGEQEAVRLRIPLWFVSLALSGLATEALIRVN